MNYVIVNGQLYHHGVKGMKWGVRKAKDNYKSAKQKYRDANKQRQWGFGVDGIAKAQANQKKASNAYANMATAKAKYKAAKAKNSAKAEKAEFKSYVKSLRKNGLPGSDYDTSRGGRSTALLNKIKTEKGKQYADKVAKKLQKQLVGEIIGGAAIGVGMAVVAGILESRID